MRAKEFITEADPYKTLRDFDKIRVAVGKPSMFGDPKAKKTAWMGSARYNTSGRTWRHTDTPTFSFNAGSEYEARRYVRGRLPKSARNVEISVYEVPDRSQDQEVEEQSVNWKFQPGWEVHTPNGDGVIQRIDGMTAYVELYDQQGAHPYDFNELMIIDTHNIEEQTPKKNAAALVGSGRGPTGTHPKGKGDSPEHRKVRTPGTTYSKRPNQKKYGKPGAEDGFVG